MWHFYETVNYRICREESLMWTRNFVFGMTVPSLRRFKKYVLIALLLHVIFAGSLSAAATIHFEGTVEEDSGFLCYIK